MTKITEDALTAVANLHVSEKPHLRLFLSADIVGSTAFKQSAKSEANNVFPAWFSIVLQFYQLAEQSLAYNWKAVDSRRSEDGADIYGEPPELWKTVGDEVLFSKRIDHPGQAVVCMHAWIATLDELRGKLREFKLDVKATSWIADFPLRNNEIVLQRKSEKSLEVQDQFYIKNNQDALMQYYDDSQAGDFLRDFIGPSIDTGFRLGAFASARKLVLSVELAYVIGTEQARAAKDKRMFADGVYALPKFEFKYEGRHSLKGVLGGAPYPIIWIDLDPENSVYRAEDDVLKTPKPTALEIKELSGAFIKSEPLLVMPYIECCPFDDYGTLSLEQADILVKRRMAVEKMQDTVNAEQELEGGKEEKADDVFVNVHVKEAIVESVSADVVVAASVEDDCQS